MSLLKRLLKWLQWHLKYAAMLLTVDALVWDDPAWLIGSKPKLETVQMFEKARERVGLDPK